MAGALIQLVAYGIQDLYLTSNPQITYFKAVYRRHTNFAVESVVQRFSSPVNFGESVSCTLGRVGDLVGRTFLYVEIPSIPKFCDIYTGEEDLIKKFAWVRNLGYALIQEIMVEIGGQLIDRQYGEWMYIWSQVANRQDVSLDKMLGNVPSMYNFTNGKASYGIYVPLDFWFNKNTGLYLPLISLSAAEVKITVLFRRAEECYRIGPTNSIEVLEDVVPLNEGVYIEQTISNQTIRGYVMGYDYIQKQLHYLKIQSPTSTKNSFESLNEPLKPTDIINNIAYKNNIPYRIYDSIDDLNYCTPKPNSKEKIEIVNLPQIPRIINSFLYVDYVYLDSEERFKFVRTNLEYLIEQVQFNQMIGIKSPNVKQNLVLNHPCKSHYWVAQLDGLVGPGTINDLFNYTTSVVRYPSGRLFGVNLVEYARLLINGQSRFSERDGGYFNLVVPYQTQYRGPETGINMYSFSIYPENYQPSGTINMSKIDDVNAMITLNSVINAMNSCRIRSYTLNYNILRIFFNLGSLVFV